MAKHSIAVGFAVTGSGLPGVATDEVSEKRYFADLVRNSRLLREGESINPDLTLSNSMQIVADAYATLNYFAIRYVVWRGGYWTVRQVTVQPPRLHLELGGVYNGPRA